MKRSGVYESVASTLALGGVLMLGFGMFPCLNPMWFDQGYLLASLFSFVSSFPILWIAWRLSRQAHAIRKEEQTEKQPERSRLELLFCGGGLYLAGIVTAWLASREHALQPTGSSLDPIIPLWLPWIFIAAGIAVATGWRAAQRGRPVRVGWLVGGVCMGAAVALVGWLM
jgi:hypothetical protein